MLPWISPKVKLDNIEDKPRRYVSRSKEQQGFKRQVAGFEAICTRQANQPYPFLQHSQMHTCTPGSQCTVMVVKIRLARFGKRNAPFYNIVVAQARSAVQPNTLKANPHLHH